MLVFPLEALTRRAKWAVDDVGEERHGVCLEPLRRPSLVQKLHPTAKYDVVLFKNDAMVDGPVVVMLRP